MNVASLRHEKEKIYRLISIIIGALIWLGILLGTFGTVIMFLIPMAISLFIAERMMRVVLFGHALRVSENQLPEVYAIVKQCAQDMSLQQIPTVFVVDSGGLANALAVKFLRTRYVILYSHLLDMLDQKQIAMIIGHELAHHAAGHTGFWLNLLMMPSLVVPFLGGAYSRARELTADRIGAAWVSDPEASKLALVALSCGSLRFTPRLQINAFREQENQVPAIFGFLMNLYATHPRTTKRIIELDEFFRQAA